MNQKPVPPSSLETPAPVVVADRPNTPGGLDPAAVERALQVVYGVDAKAQQRAQLLLTRLMAAASPWGLEGDVLTDAPELKVRLSGEETLKGLFEHEGNLALVRLANDHFLLLLGRAGRWFALNGNGEAIAEIPRLPQGLRASDLLETLVLQLECQATPALEAIEALQRVLRLAWAEVGVASLLINGGLLALPLFSMLIYNKVVYNGVFSTLWALTIGMLIFLGIDVSMRLIRNWATERISADFCRRDDERIWQNLARQNETPKGGFARLLSNYRELAGVRDFVSSGYLLAIADAPFFFLYLLVIAIIAWPLALVVLVLALAYGVVGWRNHEALRRASREVEQVAVSKVSYLGEALSALDVLRLSPGQGWFDRRWRTFCSELARRETVKRLTAGHTMVLTVSVSTFTSVCILTAGVYLIEERLTNVGGLIACNLLAGRGMALISSLFSAISKMHDFRRAVGRLEDALEPETPADSAGPVSVVARPAVSGQLQIAQLSKHYPGRPPVLTEISFAVRPGERIALLGRPGAGKSTLLRCIARLTRPDAGQILFDGAEVSGLARTDMQRWLAYKAQTPALFAGSLEENLRVALAPGDEGGQARLDGALWASGLEDELRAGRMNLSMILEEQGRNLSGGQQQKIALARALAQGARFLLLDEPSLALDPESEKQLAERLPQVMAADDVLLMISHSAAMLSAVGRILVLENGRIVADGERDKLLRGPQ